MGTAVLDHPVDFGLRRGHTRMSCAERGEEDRRQTCARLERGGAFGAVIGDEPMALGASAVAVLASGIGTALFHGDKTRTNVRTDPAPRSDLGRAGGPGVSTSDSAAAVPGGSAPTHEAAAGSSRAPLTETERIQHV